MSVRVALPLLPAPLFLQKLSTWYISSEQILLTTLCYQPSDAEAGDIASLNPGCEQHTAAVRVQTGLA